MRSVLKSCTLAALAVSLSLVAAQAATAADLLGRIKEKDEIVVGTEARYPPFEYVDNGKIVGYGVDLFDEVRRGFRA